MAKSILYAANTGNQVLTVGDEISFGTPIRRFGCNCDMRGDNAYIIGAGYYLVDAGITFVADAAGIAVVTLLKDGVAIPGANASVTTAAAGTYDIDISAVVRQLCPYDSTITAVLTGVAGTVTNATIIVEKV